METFEREGGEVKNAVLPITRDDIHRILELEDLTQFEPWQYI
jgi:hypothetical protein